MATSNDLFQDLVGIPEGATEVEALRLMIELANAAVGADESSLLILQRGPDERDELVFLLTDHLGDASVAERTLRGQRVPLGEGLTGIAAVTREPQIGAPLYEDLKQAGDAPQMVLAVPMLSGDEVLGVLTAVTWKADKKFTRGDVEIYGKVASVVSVVIDQRRRLGMLDGLRADEELPPSRTPAEDLEKRVVATVARMVRRRPEGLANLLAVLEAVDRYAPSGSP